MRLTFDVNGKDMRRAQRRANKRRKGERLMRVLNVAGGYDGEPDELKRALVKRVYAETTGRHRLERNVLGGTLERLERYEIERREALAS